MISGSGKRVEWLPRGKMAKIFKVSTAAISYHKATGRISTKGESGNVLYNVQDAIEALRNGHSADIPYEEERPVISIDLDPDQFEPKNMNGIDALKKMIEGDASAINETVKVSRFEPGTQIPKISTAASRNVGTSPEPEQKADDNQPDEEIVRLAREELARRYVRHARDCEDRKEFQASRRMLWLALETLGVL